MSLTTTIAHIATMNVYRVLKGEHDEVSMLFKAIEATPNNMESGRHMLFTKLKNELLSHAHAEQKHVYDKLKDKAEDKTLVQHAEKEHHEIETGLKELAGANMATQGWLDKLTKLKNTVEHHVAEEESKMFAQMHEVFSESEDKAISEAFVEAKRAELEKLRA